MLKNQNEFFKMIATLRAFNSMKNYEVFNKKTLEEVYKKIKENVISFYKQNGRIAPCFLIIRKEEAGNYVAHNLPINFPFSEDYVEDIEVLKTILCSAPESVNVTNLIFIADTDIKNYRGKGEKITYTNNILQYLTNNEMFQEDYEDLMFSIEDKNVRKVELYEYVKSDGNMVISKKAINKDCTSNLFI